MNSNMREIYIKQKDLLCKGEALPSRADDLRQVEDLQPLAGYFPQLH